MHRVLREHAIMLRAQADELDNLASVLEQTEIGFDAGYSPVTKPIEVPVVDEDDLPGDMTIAVPDGQVDVRYNLADLVRVNEEATLLMAKHDALQGKVVMLDYGDPEKNQIWSKETFSG